MKDANAQGRLHGIEGAIARTCNPARCIPSQPSLPILIMNTSKYITYAIASSPEVFHYLVESYIDALRVVARVPGLLPRRDRVEPRFLDLGHGGPATEAAAQVGTTLTVEDGQDH
jgi:hypothetical protein